jgi:hypothetical protein
VAIFSPQVNHLNMPQLSHAPLPRPSFLYGAETCCTALPGASLTRLGCSPVLVDHSTEDSVTSDRGVTVDDGRGIVAGWALAEALVRAVIVEMVHVLVEDGASVSFVVDQQPVGAFRTDTARLIQLVA